MDTLSILSRLKTQAESDETLRADLLRTSSSDHPLRAFCETARAYGFDLYEMGLIEAGNDAYASMKRSQNGGGENSPALAHTDDYFEAFLESLSK